MIVRHSGGSYPIVMTDLATALTSLPPDAAILTDANVAAIAPIPRDVPTLVLPAGEATKSLDKFGEALGWLARIGASRRTTVVALGGGVIGDLAGFVAAAYMRGVPLLGIPTTLLAMVDSSVEERLGIDLPEGKNLAGAFWPPIEVRLPLDALRTLTSRHRTNGLAEVLKYGFIMDAPLLEEEFDGDLEKVVLRCVALKAQVVEEDEREITGRRAILNFGHTVGHAVERLTGYGPVLHGEAIAVGMTVEAELGERIGIAPPGTAKTVKSAFARHGLPTTHPILKETDAMLATMRGDKKAVEGNLAFSLLTKIGDCKLIASVPERRRAARFGIGMTNLRTILTALVVALLVLGWGGASFAAMDGRANEWATRLDGPTAGPIRLLALIVLLAAIVLAFVPDRESEG